MLCLDRDTGKILWTKTAFEGVPKIKRHLKGSQANCTPATDGKRVVACFGSEGLYCYDFDGKLLWKRDLGTLDSSFALDSEYEWGFGSSPVIHEDRVILQCDLSRDSFIAAYSLEDGSQVWSTPRDEIPSWSTPTIWRNCEASRDRDQRLAVRPRLRPGDREGTVAAGQEVGGDGADAGRHAATLLSSRAATGRSSRSSRSRPGPPGDISLKTGETSNAHVAWGRLRGGPYMPTPIVYGEHLYTLGNSGMVTCYEAATGKEVYKERLGGTSYTASPVAADGRLYFVSEQGEVRVVKAGPEFELLAVNEIGEVCMATPAISGGVLFVRTKDALIAFGRK